MEKEGEKEKDKQGHRGLWKKCECERVNTRETETVGVSQAGRGSVCGCVRV